MIVGAFSSRDQSNESIIVSCGCFNHENTYLSFLNGWKWISSWLDALVETCYNQWWGYVKSKNNCSLVYHIAGTYLSHIFWFRTYGLLTVTPVWIQQLICTNWFHYRIIFSCLCSLIIALRCTRVWSSELFVYCIGMIGVVVESFFVHSAVLWFLVQHYYVWGSSQLYILSDQMM